MKIDKKDRQILYELDKDSRQSLTQLGKKVGLHRNVVQYRIKKMEKQGIIKGYFTEINSLALGYMSFRILMKLSHATREQEQEIIDFLKSEPRTIWLFRVVGRWDIDVVLAVKDTFECQKFLQEFLTKYNGRIEEKNVAILSQIFHYPKDYLVKDSRQPTEKSFVKIEKNSLSNDETALLGQLNTDGSLGIVELSRRTGQSINTVVKNIKELKRKKVILGFRPFIDTKKTGYNYYKIHVNIRHYSDKDFRRFKSRIEADPHVIFINHAIGSEDIEVELHLESQDKLNEFTKSLRDEFGFMFKDSYTMQFVEEFVYRYLPES